MGRISRMGEVEAALVGAEEDTPVRQNRANPAARAQPSCRGQRLDSRSPCRGRTPDHRIHANWRAGDQPPLSILTSVNILVHSCAGTSHRRDTPSASPSTRHRDAIAGINRPESNRRRVAATVGGRDPAVELTRTSLQRVAANRLRLLLQPSIWSAQRPAEGATFLRKRLACNHSSFLVARAGRRCRGSIQWIEQDIAVVFRGTLRFLGGQITL